MLLCPPLTTENLAHELARLAHGHAGPLLITVPDSRLIHPETTARLKKLIDVPFYLLHASGDPSVRRPIGQPRPAILYTSIGKSIELRSQETCIGPGTSHPLAGSGSAIRFLWMEMGWMAWGESVEIKRKNQKLSIFNLLKNGDNLRCDHLTLLFMEK